MKNLNWKVAGAAIMLLLFTVLICAFPLQAGENNSVKTLVEQMKAGETGSTGGGSPPGPFGDHWVHLQENSTVDSYDSRIGDYGASHDSEANVGCNVTPNDSQAGISIDNNATVKGDVSVTTTEEAGDITVLNAAVTGSLNYECPKWDLIPITLPEWQTEAGGVPNGQIDGTYGSKPGTYEITNNTFHAYNNADVTFHAGVYHFDTFEMSNNVDFQIDPDIGEDEVIEIYVGNSIVLENNSELLPPIQFSGDTTKLRFYFNGTTKVDLSNNVEFYGFIYAPNALIEVRNNDNIFGNLVGKEVWIWNNGAVHYDKALLSKDFGSVFTGGIPAAPHNRVDWKELIIAE